MMIRRINITLIAMFLVLVAIVFLVRRDYAVRNLKLLPGMVTHMAYPALSQSSVFGDNKILQPPVQGTIVRGFAPLQYQPGPQGAVRAGEDLRSPLLSVDSAVSVERGAAVFATQCAPCHGATGTGDGIVAQRGFPPPPSLFADGAMRMKDGQMYHVITFGQQNMPSLASQVARDDRWRVIAYVRSLQFQYKATALSMK